jgi:ferritin-like metal-binding protein YciE
MSDNVEEQVERRVEMHDIQRAIESNTETTQQIYTKLDDIDVLLRGKKKEKEDLGIVGIIASHTQAIAKLWNINYFLVCSILAACFFVIRAALLSE